jgi:uncharacterized metal-binding protein
MDYSKKELVYSCSGCSSAAQTANSIAVKLDRAGVAEMSCIAGVGGDVPALVRVAKSGRPVTVIDGCPLQCAKSCLARHGVVPTRHYDLSKFGVKKIQHGDISSEDADKIFEMVKTAIEGNKVKDHG